jgi:predicted O-methyltransferase YrrM
VSEERLEKLIPRMAAYVDERFGDRDVELERALADSKEAGLSEIQVSPAEGRLLRMLAEITGAERILEIGTLGGYSAIQLARALPAARGYMLTLEVDASAAEVARKNLERAGLSDRVEVRLGDATKLLEEMGDGSAFDLTFIDADKQGYPYYLRHALRLSRPGSLILADNTLRSGRVIEPQNDSTEAISRFNELVSTDERLSTTFIPTLREGIDGLTVSHVLPT